MKISWFKSSISYFFIALFFTMEMASFHVLSHNDHDDHGADCSICIQINVTNLTPILSPDFDYSPIEYIAFTVKRDTDNTYNFLGSNIIDPNQLFSRPPPSVL
ncbi:hypothetical protein [Algibacter pacificus]|uniref:hypothetical protein n=1 Tax=Algibacter pacificus TaxID=2599389 RepID=UPI0011CCC081|nr:hypothetical protein [Algibacter pacificus]